MSNERWKLPNFFVVGAQKCGTTSLFEQLRKHSQVFIPEIKEPEFFATPPPPGQRGKILQWRACRTVEEYRHVYRDAGKFAAVGDLSPGYLWDPRAPGSIRETCPEAKIVIMLRDPVMRAHSAYLMNYGRGRDTSPNFGEALRRDAVRDKSHYCGSYFYVEYGLYAEPVARYFDVFGRDRVLVLLFDELAADPQALFTRLAYHIGIDPQEFHSLELSEVHNAYRMPRFMKAFRIAGALGLRTKLIPRSMRNRLHDTFLFERQRKPPLDEKSRQYLQEIYEPDVSRLENILGRSLPELRRSWTAEAALPNGV